MPKKKKELTEADAMASWMASGAKRKPGETDREVIKRAIKAQKKALGSMR